MKKTDEKQKQNKTKQNKRIKNILETYSFWIQNPGEVISRTWGLHNKIGIPKEQYNARKFDKLFFKRSSLQINYWVKFLVGNLSCSALQNISNV